MQSRREESKLARAVRSVNDALEGCLQDMAAYLGLKTGGRLSMERNFSDVSLEPEEMRLLIELEAAGKLTHGTLLRQLQSGGRVLQGIDVDEELRAVAHQEQLEPDGAFDPESIRAIADRLSADSGNQ